MQQSRLVKSGLLPCDAGVDGAESVARLGLLLSDIAVSQRNALKELVQLVKLGLPPHDAVVSRRKALIELSQLQGSVSC